MESKAHKIKLQKLVADASFHDRYGLNADAVARYAELYREGGLKAPLLVQKGSLRIIDGMHRYHAAHEAGLEEVYVQEVECADSDLAAESFRANREHGVPYGRAERDHVICRLYKQGGKWTQKAIGELVGLSERGVRRVLEADGVSAPNTPRKVTDPEIVALSLAGVKQGDIAEQAGVSQGRVAQIVGEFEDRAVSAYEAGATKAEVAHRLSSEKCRLAVTQMDAILAKAGDPVNFTPQVTSVWECRADSRYGQQHPGNLPPGVVENVVWLCTRPGDVVLDPFAGGGVTIDVCDDMVGRRCAAFDLRPERKDICQHDVAGGPPGRYAVPRAEPAREAIDLMKTKPALIFLDPPYGPQKAVEYGDKTGDLSALGITEFYEAMANIAGYWKEGHLALVVGGRSGGAETWDIAFECHQKIQKRGWKERFRIVLPYRHADSLRQPETEAGAHITQAKRSRFVLWHHRDLMIYSR